MAARSEERRFRKIINDRIKVLDGLIKTRKAIIRREKCGPECEDHKVLRELIYARKNIAWVRHKATHPEEEDRR